MASILRREGFLDLKVPVGFGSTDALIAQIVGAVLKVKLDRVTIARISGQNYASVMLDGITIGELVRNEAAYARAAAVAVARSMRDAARAAKKRDAS